jgi:signal transduction histidine kinase
LEERSRLAREMHDTVIQGCASISALLEALSSLDPAGGGGQPELLAVARAQARVTIDEARDVVWNLRKGHASAEDLVLQLGGMIDRMRQESGIEMSYTVSGRPFEINQTVAHELAMATREAVSNAVRHSEAALIDVTVSFQKDDFMIEVQDTGIGFDPKLTHLGGDRHYGLVGIAERMRRIGGRFTLNSARGTGTHLKLEAPRKATAVETVAAGITE